MVLSVCNDGGMARTTPSKKSLPAVIGGVVLVLVAGYFGIDLGGDSGSSSQESSSATSAPASASGTASGTAGDEGASEGSCALDTLPAEAAETVDYILAGGPYEYPDNDNVRFGNYEGVLPQESRDYYREYTVETPGLKHRGTRRIVTGGGSETDPDVWYYTDDHYESFCSIPDAEG